MFKDELLRLWHTYFNAAGIATNYAEYQGYIILEEFGAACLVVPDNFVVNDADIIKAAKDTKHCAIFVLKGLPEPQTYPQYHVHLKGEPIGQQQGCHVPVDDIEDPCKKCDKEKDCCCGNWSWVLARCRGEYGRMWGDFGEGPEEYQDLRNYPKDTGRGVANGLAAVRDRLGHEIARAEEELALKRRYVDSIADHIETYQRWDAAPYPK